jgi:hypothetical protein
MWFSLNQVGTLSANAGLVQNISVSQGNTYGSSGSVGQLPQTAGIVSASTGSSGPATVAATSNLGLYLFVGALLYWIYFTD